MDGQERFDRLLASLCEVADLNAAAALLEWDEQTSMPAGAAEVRGEQLATVSRLAHERFIRPEVGEWIGGLGTFEREHAPESFEASLLRVARREYEQAVKLPPDLVHALARATSQAFHAWVEARRADRFEGFRPHLETVLRLSTEKAERLGWRDEPYDALLDQYEPGFRAADVAELFADLRAGLLELLGRIRAAGEAQQPDLPRGDYPEDAQERLGRRVLEAIGFDFDRGRLERSAHPFTTSMGAPDDVRVTSRYDRADFTSALFAAVHEGGHGLYEQGFPRRLRGTPLAAGASLGFHESQSRLWENMVGRSLPFCRFLLPLAQQALGGPLERVDAEALYRAVNRVRPSLIRVEADEVTYNLHIMLRFELERRLIGGELAVADLPEAWKEAMDRYLGIRPAGEADGVLQDVHWAHGLFGYFPTYALGNLLAATLWTEVSRDLPGQAERFDRGDFGGLLTWLRERVHVHGAKFMPKDLVLRITGQPLRAGPFLTYLRAKYEALYGL